MMPCVVLLMLVIAFLTQTNSFTPSTSLARNSVYGYSSLSMACRRNNKLEKRKRNREYARKFQNKMGSPRKTLVIEQKRAIIATAEERFQSELYKMTTDDDMPEYTGFDFLA